MAGAALLHAATYAHDFRFGTIYRSVRASVHVIVVEHALF